MINLYENLQLSDELFIMPSHRLLLNLYPSPLIEFFDFIEKTDERFKIWLETRQKLMDYRHEFYEGLFKTINDGSEFVSVDKKYRRVENKSMVLCEIKYKPRVGEGMVFYSYP